jgi:O-antigen ligase
MILPFLAARMFSHLDPRSSGNEGFRKLILAKESSFFFRDTLIFALVLLGLIFSLSRAGIAAGVVGLGVAGVLTLTRSRGYGLILLLAILLVAGAYASWIGLLPLFARVGELDLVMSDTTMRMDIWRDTVRLILDSPLLGTGLGTYNWASLQYQSSLLQYRYEHAHNDILQTAAELGVPLAVGLWAGLMALLIRLIRKAPHFSRTPDRVLAAGCSGAMAAILLHSLFDFNLQIPANALIFAWITGTAAALAQSRRTRSMQESPQLAHPFAAGPIVVDTQALDDPS